MLNLLFLLSQQLGTFAQKNGFFGKCWALGFFKSIWYFLHEVFFVGQIWVFSKFWLFSA